MEVGASTVINEAAASCSQSPANSSAALPAAVVPACSAASPKAVQEDEKKGSERTGVEGRLSSEVGRSTRTDATFTHCPLWFVANLGPWIFINRS